MSPNYNAYPLEIRNGLIYFYGSELDSKIQLKIHNTEVYAFAYRFPDNQGEEWTARINAFKEGNPEVIRKFSYILSLYLNFLSAELVGHTICVGIIKSSKEELENIDPLYQMIERVNNNLGFSWRQDLLSKKIHPSLHRIDNPSSRDRIIYNTYSFSYIPNFSIDNLVIFDDICTKGSTFKECIRAAKATYPDIKRCICISIGRTENEWFHADFPHRNVNNNHIPPALSIDWENGTL